MTTAALFAMLFVFMFLGTPIGVALGLSSLLTILLFGQDSLASLALKLYETSEHFTLLSIPFFILGGAFMTTGGVAKRMIRFAVAVVGHLRGGLAMASVLACMLFAAVSGSSPATVVAVGSIVIAGMVRAGYPKSFAAGVVCNAGTLGILIPPSIVMVVYGATTETSVGKLFMAGVVPGILLGLLLMVAIYVLATIRDLPRQPRATLSEIVVAGRDSLWGLLLIVIILGGIYGGVFTPTEAAGIGAFGAFAISCWKRSMSLARLEKALVDTVHTTGSIFAILIGATVLSNFINMTGAPELFADAVRGMELGPIWILLGIIVLYIILGCFFETLSVLLITLPVFLPLILGAGIDLIWFGVLVVVTVELGLITPPFGMNVFVMASSARGIDTGVVFRGLIPFICADLVRLGLLIAFPIISLYLPGLMR